MSKELSVKCLACSEGVVGVFSDVVWFAHSHECGD